MRPALSVSLLLLSVAVQQACQRDEATAPHVLRPTASVVSSTSKIAFTSRRDGHGQIYMIDPDGSNEVRVTHDPANDSWPWWSPNAQEIAYQSELRGNSEIFVTNADDLLQLTDAVAHDVDPAWSPDGSQIAFASQRDGDFEIYAMDSDGQHPRRLTRAAGADTQPAWSPDGRSIAFTRQPDRAKQICVMLADGSGLVKLAEDAASPAWSPDGKNIAFTTGGNIGVMHADGTGRRRLTDKADSRHPAWSADGKNIVFESNRDGHYQLFMIDASGGKVTRLTSDPAGYVGPPWHDASEAAWSPDGKTSATT